jgi:hypothetical protein
MLHWAGKACQGKHSSLVISLNFCNLQIHWKICLTSKLPRPPWPQQTLVLKTSPLKNAPNFIYLFNCTAVFCINTCAMVLIKQCSTGLFVSYYSVRRKIQLHETSVVNTAPDVEINKGLLNTKCNSLLDKNA